MLYSQPPHFSCEAPSNFIQSGQSLFYVGMLTCQHNRPSNARHGSRKKPGIRKRVLKYFVGLVTEFVNQNSLHLLPPADRKLLASMFRHNDCDALTEGVA